MNKYQTVCVSLFLSDGIELYGATCALQVLYCNDDEKSNTFDRRKLTFTTGIQKVEVSEKWKCLPALTD